MVRRSSGAIFVEIEEVSGRIRRGMAMYCRNAGRECRHISQRCRNCAQIGFGQWRARSSRRHPGNAGHCLRTRHAGKSERIVQLTGMSGSRSAVTCGQESKPVSRERPGDSRNVSEMVGASAVRPAGTPVGAQRRNHAGHRAGGGTSGGARVYIFRNCRFPAALRRTRWPGGRSPRDRAARTFPVADSTIVRRRIRALVSGARSLRRCRDHLYSWY